MNTQTKSTEASSLTRRDFLTRAGGAVAGSVVASSFISPTMLAYADDAVTTETSAAADTAAAAQEGEVKVWDGVELSMGRIVHNPDLCAGCRQCEMVCVMNKWGVVNPEIALIKINTDILGGYISSAETCKQCPGAECVAVCPTKANHVDPETGARVIDLSLCTGCQVCLYACPVVPSRVHYNPQANVCQKCDLCGGEPMCVQYCPTGAITSSWMEATSNTTAVETASGITVNLALTGSIVHIAGDTIQVSNVNAEISNGVVVTGEISSTYSQPFTAKIKVSFFDAENTSLSVLERLEIHVEPNTTEPFSDVFETETPETVKYINLEIMCGKIAG
jgi:Fe-S-cluster-containing dehydrogenase component